MSFSAYTGSVKTTISDNPQNSGTSSSLNFGSPGASSNITRNLAYSVGTGAGAINQVATGVLTMAASGSATLNLQSLTNMLGVATVVLVSLKKFIFWLLSPNDDTVNGTACTSVTVGAAGSNANNLNMGGTTPTFTLTGNPTGIGDQQSYSSGTAAGITVSSTVKNVLVTNNDASHGAAVFYNLGGHD